MDSIYSRELVKFQTALQWRRLMDEEHGRDTLDLAMLDAVRAYMMDLKFRMGIGQPYQDELVRLATLKMTLRSLDPVFDEIARRSENVDVVPPEAEALRSFLINLTLDLAGVIHFTELRHPELEEFFRVERVLYSDLLNSEGSVTSST